MTFPFNAVKHYWALFYHYASSLNLANELKRLKYSVKNEEGIAILYLFVCFWLYDSRHSRLDYSCAYVSRTFTCCILFVWRKRSANIRTNIQCWIFSDIFGQKFCSVVKASKQHTALDMVSNLLCKKQACTTWCVSSNERPQKLMAGLYSQLIACVLWTNENWS